MRIGFLENAPPKETLDRPTDKDEISKFDIGLRVENVGESPVPANNIKVTIGGIYSGDFNVPNQKTSSLDGALKTALEGVRKDPEGEKLAGGIDEVTFLDLGYTKSLQGNNEFPIQADVCYPYQTKAVADFCMRKDLIKATSGVCQVKGSKPVFSSGAPIHVASFDESVGGSQKVILKFNIKAVGTGTFYKPGGCKKGDFQEENFVRVTVDSGMPSLSLKCSGWGDSLTKDVRLTNGEASVTCIQSGVNVDAVRKMDIFVDYNHLITASTKILVKHLPGEFADVTPTANGICQSGEKKGCTTAGGKAGTQECIDKQWTICVESGGAP